MLREAGTKYLFSGALFPIKITTWVITHKKRKFGCRDMHVGPFQHLCGELEPLKDQQKSFAIHRVNESFYIIFESTFLGQIISIIASYKLMS